MMMIMKEGRRKIKTRKTRRRRRKREEKDGEEGGGKVKMGRGDREEARRKKEEDEQEAKQIQGVQGGIGINLEGIYFEGRTENEYDMYKYEIT